MGPGAAGTAPSVSPPITGAAGTNAAMVPVAGSSPVSSAGGAAGAMVAGAAGGTEMPGMMMPGGSGGAAMSGAGGSGTAGSTPDVEVPAEHFSFFVTSLQALRELSGSQDGFGGDLTFGETGPGAGLRGADKICATIADRSMPGASGKGWRAFLSAAKGEDGKQVNAIDRIGEGPWYDRLGRLFAMNKAGLLHFRPEGDAAIINDLPNENGVPNMDPDGTGPVDNHDTLTGSDAQGRLCSAMATCLDWTSKEGNQAVSGKPRVGHAWPRMGFPGFPGGGGAGSGGFGGGGFGGGGFPGGGPNLGSCDMTSTGGDNNDGYGHWISSLTEAGCAPSVRLEEMGAPRDSDPSVGSGGGYGGFYCFALKP